MYLTALEKEKNPEKISKIVIEILKDCVSD